MSIYEELATEFNDLDMLVEAIEQAGLTCTVYPQNDGVYRKWAGSTNHETHTNEGGRVRGRDAAVVIHGGLDTWEPAGKYGSAQAPTTDGMRGGPGWYCGDTAFVRQADGRYEAKADIAHGNAGLNWTKVKDNYAALMVEKVAQANGLPCERTTNAQGNIVLRVKPKTATRIVGRQVLRG